MIPKLGVNIDHVATLRQARTEDYPSIATAAQIVLEAGADQITVHLREDRRHIQDFDIPIVREKTQQFGRTFNFEMGCNAEILQMAVDVKPEWVCLVPEKREEQTTEGGLDLKNIEIFKKVDESTKLLQKHGIKVSLFVEADTKIMQHSIEMGADAVEIHTGEFAMAFQRGQKGQEYLDQFSRAFEMIEASPLLFHAGHGLTDKSVQPLLEQGLFAEYNIGHWIVSQAVFQGLGNVVEQMKQQFNQFPVRA